MSEISSKAMALILDGESDIFWGIVSEPGKNGADVIFVHFQTEMEAFKETRPEKEISGRDLYGGGHMGGEMEGNMR